MERLSILVWFGLIASIASVTQAAIQPVNSVIHHLGVSAVLQCIPTSTGAELTWYKNGEEIKVETNDDENNFEIDRTNSSLRIKHVGRDDVGPYVCKENDESQTTVTLSASPYSRTDKSVNLNKGNTLKLDCYAWGYPPPVVTWYGDGDVIVTDATRVLVENTTLVQKGMLVINSLEFEDYKKYTCSASNAHGSYNSTTLVRVKSPIAGIWPIIGIVIQLAIVGIIIFMYERRQKKKRDEEKRHEEEFNKSHPVDNGRSDNVRQRLSK